VQCCSDKGIECGCRPKVEKAKDRNHAAGQEMRSNWYAEWFGCNAAELLLEGKSTLTSKRPAKSRLPGMSTEDGACENNDNKALECSSASSVATEDLKE
tara:strand:+ start:475 stop:771 length:297 start_codon:yes stop_codon:yes gene_type:complete